MRSGLQGNSDKEDHAARDDGDAATEEVGKITSD